MTSLMMTNIQKLTPDLVERAVPGVVEDDPAAQPLLTDAVMREKLDRFLLENPLHEPVLVFGYGSLLWYPEVGLADPVMATLAGWQRSFCLWQWAYRGSKVNPGLMLALVPGEHCVGQVFRLEGPTETKPDLAARLWPVWKRELIGNGYVGRMVEVETSNGPRLALTFIANTESPRFVHPMPLAEMARLMAVAKGSRGASALYLCHTARRCRELGIVDQHLEGLDEAVARLLAARLGEGVPA